jgi:hypothetical protein
MGMAIAMKQFAVGIMFVGSLLASAEPQQAEAAVIFSDFGANNSYDQNSGYVVGNDSASHDLAEGASFTVGTGSSYTLQSITIALSDFKSAGASATVALETNNGSNLPGSVIDSFSTGSLPNFGASGNSPVTVTATASDALLAGNTYWVVVTTDPTNTVEWNFNSTGVSGTIAQSLDGGSTWNAPPTNHTLGAFSVQATPEQGGAVPEPTTLVLFGVGLAALIGLRRKKAMGKLMDCKWH